MLESLLFSEQYIVRRRIEREVYWRLYLGTHYGASTKESYCKKNVKRIKAINNRKENK